MLTKITTDNLWVLEQIHRLGYPTAVIAGGAVRDSYFKKPIHDIDIFYKVHPAMPGDLLDRKKVVRLLDLDIVEDLGDYEEPTEFLFFDYEDEFTVIYDSKRKSSKKHPSYYSCPHVQSIVEIGKGEHLYQLVGLSCDPLDYVKNYIDVDICRCYCDGQKMRYTQAFLNDATHNTITISGNLTSPEYNHALKYHIPKLQRYYPGFRVVDLLKDVPLPLRIYEESQC